MFSVMSVRHSVHCGGGVGDGVFMAIEADSFQAGGTLPTGMLSFVRIVYTFSLDKTLTWKYNIFYFTMKDNTMIKN